MPSSDPKTFLYLTTRGRKSNQPREIEIWFVEFEGCFYIIAEHSTSNWVKNLHADPNVQIKVAERNLNARARILSPDADRTLIASVQERSRQKYGWGDGLVVELNPGGIKP